MTVHPDRLSRDGDERWLAGVCAGLAAARASRVSIVRATFVLLALIGGLGIGLYLACWMILPAGTGTGAGAGSADDVGDGHGDERSEEHAGAVTLARAAASTIGLGALALFGAVATVFGFGWIVVALAGASLVLAGWRRLGAAWSLLPAAALAVPAVAIAASPIRLTPQLGQRAVAPATASALRGVTYRSGLGTMFIDLRRTRFPASGTVALRIRAGIRRTIVALPQNACVHVTVAYEVHPFAAQLATLLDGRAVPPISSLVLFGRLYGATDGPSMPLTVSSGGAKPGPTLVINFVSQGGGLYVRNYPSTVDPTVQPDWPGYLPPIDPRPQRAGATAKGYQQELRYWRHRVLQEHVWRTEFNRAVGGPCT